MQCDIIFFTLINKRIEEVQRTAKDIFREDRLSAVSGLMSVVIRISLPSGTGEIF